MSAKTIMLPDGTGALQEYFKTVVKSGKTYLSAKIAIVPLSAGSSKWHAFTHKQQRFEILFYTNSIQPTHLTPCYDVHLNCLKLTNEADLNRCGRIIVDQSYISDGDKELIRNGFSTNIIKSGSDVELLLEYNELKKVLEIELDINDKIKLLYIKL